MYVPEMLNIQGACICADHNEVAVRGEYPHRIYRPSFGIIMGWFCFVEGKELISVALKARGLKTASAS